MYAILNAARTVVNIIVYDGDTPYDPGEGHTIEEVPDGTQIGDELD